MCGRFAQVYDDSALKSEFQIEDIQNKIINRFNLSPGMEVNTIINSSDSNKLVKQHWGIDRIRGNELDNVVINTRSDTFLTKDFGRNFHQYRCIIPVTGFYEWNNKQPYFIKNADNSILSLGGVFIYDRRKNEYSCSVLTVNSTGSFSKLHDRMPLLIYGYDKQKWLDNTKYDHSLLEDVCFRRIDMDLLKVFRVTDRVNSLLHDSDQCITPLKENSLF